MIFFLMTYLAQAGHNITLIKNDTNLFLMWPILVLLRILQSLSIKLSNFIEFLNFAQYQFDYNALLMAHDHLWCILNGT